MRAVQIAAHGGFDRLRHVDLPDPVPGPGEVLVEVAAAGLNHLDTWVRRGIPGLQFPLPLIPGSDGAGTVAALGPGVAGPPPGTRVALQPGVSCGVCTACLRGEDFLCPAYGILGEHRNGTNAERIVVPAANLIPIGPDLAFEAAAAVPVVFLTAWHMVVTRARVQPGETVLVQAGASGVGSAALQIVRLLGGRSFTTVGSPDKADAARRLGASEVILYRDVDFAAEVRRLTGRRGVDVVLDHIGLETWEDNIRSLARGGRLVLCGATSGHEAPTNLRQLFFKNLSFLGSTMGSKAELRHVFDLVLQQRLEPIVDAVLPFSDVAEGHRRIETRAVTGKIVLAMR